MMETFNSKELEEFGVGPNLLSFIKMGSNALTGTCRKHEIRTSPEKAVSTD